MDWKKYEKEIYTYFKEQYHDSVITLDARKIGLYSRTERQIDVLIEQYIVGNKMTIAIDGKFLNKKVDVKSVESYIGMLEDIGAHKGLLISKEGFSEAAYNRAHFGPTEIELDILSFDELHEFQSFEAIPFAGNNGVILPAPFGWIIDVRSTPLGLATLYQRGCTFEQAVNNKEFMYIMFWDRNKDGHNLEDLLEIQKNNLINANASCEIEYISTIKRKDVETKLRVVRANKYPAPEYTGFVEFKNFIFFCVMFSPENRSRSNIRKLENILKTVFPIDIKFKSMGSD